jgi:hypothetical protein
MTCFLEYVDEHTVMVHDLIHSRTGNAWTMRTGSYPKLRLGADWLADRCRQAGLTVRSHEVLPSGLRVLMTVGARSR